MTIAIGIICQNAIVLAGERRTTTGSSIRDDAEKISCIKFSDGHQMLVAQSGDAVTASTVIRMAREWASKASLSSEMVPVQCFQEVIRKYKKEILEPYSAENKSLEERRQYFVVNHDMDLIFVFYYKKKPLIFQINFAEGFAFEQKNYAAIGCGSKVAEFIIKWFDFSGKTLAFGVLPIAVYIIEEVKKVDNYCGGKTNVAAISIKGESEATEAAFFRDNVVGELAKDIERLDAQAKYEWQYNMDRIIMETLTKTKASGKQTPKTKIVRPPPPPRTGGKPLNQPSNAPLPLSGQSPDAGPSTEP